MYRDLCDHHFALGCSNLGELLESGRGVHRDPAAAVRQFRAACDAKEQYGCANLGRVLREGKWVKQDTLRGAELLREACESGITKACDP